MYFKQMTQGDYSRENIHAVCLSQFQQCSPDGSIMLPHSVEFSHPSVVLKRAQLLQNCQHVIHELKEIVKEEFK